MRLPQRAVVEGLGTCLLVTAVIGSGVMAERLAGGNMAVALLANTLATAGALIALILTFGPISGAHFNPLVTLSMAIRKNFAWGDVSAYLVAQVIGAVLGAWLVHLMFDLPIFQASTHIRTGLGQWVGEVVATFILLSVIFSVARHTPGAVPYAVAATIAAGYWFTSSTSFANPAVTVARAFSDTFAGIRPMDVAGFIAAQCVGAGFALALFNWLERGEG